VILAFFLTHWFQFNYAEPGQPFYRAADWPNVFVILPVAILGFLYVRSRHLAVLAAHRELRAAHVEHAAKLDRLLDHLDPYTPGPIADVLDRLEPKTPGGIGVLNDKLDRVGRSLADLHGRHDALEPVKPDTTLHLDHPEDAK
jgi:hypothetical protein